MSLHRKRVKAFERLLQNDEIDIKELQNLSINGIPDEKGLRSLVWKILLHYLPTKRSEFKSVLAKKRDSYKQFIEEIIVSPGGPADHPLSVSPNSSWGNYFKDNEVLLQINKDVKRLCPEISFFQSATEFPCEQVVNSNGERRLHQRVEQTVQQNSNVENNEFGQLKSSERKTMDKNCNNFNAQSQAQVQEAHWEVVERMLFIYAKLNPGQGYVQGMNEIIGPIYHTFASDPNEEFRKYAEADCFFSFTNLMGEIRDLFIRILDNSESGINKMMDKLVECLKETDLEVWNRLEEQEIKPQYFSFRWITLLLSQEFPLPDVERIWDSLFADPNRFNFLIHICCAMIVLVRTSIMDCDFATNIKILQKFPPMDVSVILNKAMSIANTCKD